MKNYKQTALKLAKAAGKIMRDNFVPNIDNEWKGDNTPVTKVDYAINKLVLETIGGKYPTHSVLAEEESDMKSDAEYVWVCDPLDGTLPFSFGVPIFTFSIALVKDGEPILGVVYDPITDRMYSAEKGKGAFLNDQKIEVNKQSSLKHAVFNVDGDGDVLPNYNFIKIFDNLRKQNSKVFKFYSIINSGMLVAAGGFSGAIFLKDTAHDSATIKIMVEEAGGKVTDLDGNDQRYDEKCNGLVATNGLVHEQVLDMIGKSKT
ncbi:inositol monophosphatase [Patescibacteria group bacterium]|nr:inositol monophosphatase [Patescibacteria group bacterium]